MVLAAVCLSTTSASSVSMDLLTLRGTLVMVHEGGAMHYFMDVGGRLSRELVFRAGAAPNLRPGLPLEVDGVGHGRTISVSAVARLAGRAVAPSTAGTKKLLVILVQWPASARSTGVISTTPSAANAFVFGTTDVQRRSVTQWYEDVSYGQLEWTGDVTSILRIADPGSCDLYTIANRSDAAAAAAGYTLGNYTNRMYDFPPGYCGTSAGEIAGPRSWILDGLHNIDDGYQRMAPDHELGHNLGEWHGHGLDCGSDVLSAACIAGASGAIECDVGGSSPCINEYGDAYDVMGSNWTSDGWDAVNWFGIWHEMRLGWVSGRTITDDQPPTAQDHLFTIAPIESSTGDVGLTLTTDAGRRYVVEYRQPLSQDAFLVHEPAATSGVLISMANPVAGFAPDTGPVTLDTRPDSDVSTTYSDWFDAPLGVGQTFTDVDGSFSLSLDVASASGASLTVHWLGAPGTTTLDQMDPAVAYNGWRGAVDTTADGGAYRVSGAKNDTATWTSPAAASLSWVTRTGPDLGRASVRIDGVNKGTVDLYAAASASATHTYSGLPNRAHTVVVRVLGTRNASSSGTDVPLDAFTAGAATTQESAPAIVYDTWANANSTKAEGGNYRVAAAATAKARVLFTGTGIDWITAKGKAYGRARVTIDGVSKGTVDLYAAAQAWKSVIAFSGLVPGAHTMVIQVLGQRSASATGSKIVLDGFKVHG